MIVTEPLLAYCITKTRITNWRRFDHTSVVQNYEIRCLFFDIGVIMELRTTATAIIFLAPISAFDQASLVICCIFKYTLHQTEYDLYSPY